MHDEVVEYILNPALQVSVRFTTRLRGRGSLTQDFPVARHPELARFLLEAAAQGGLTPETRKLALPLLTTLVDAGFLVPSSQALRPVPLALAFREPFDLRAPSSADARAFSLNPRLELQRGPELPEAVLKRAPAARELDLGAGPWAWVQSLRSGLWFPVWLAPSRLHALEALSHGRLGAGELEPETLSYFAASELIVHASANAGSEADSEAGSGQPGFGREGHAVARGLLTAFQTEVLRRHFGSLRREGYFELDRQQVVGKRSSMHNEPLSRLIQTQLASWASRLVRRPLKPTYSYLTTYEPGARLERHTDREQCAWNISLWIDSEGPATPAESWPLYLDVEGNLKAIRLLPGDAVLYEGFRTPHWRDPLAPDTRATVLLGHYVAASFEGELD